MKSRFGGKLVSELDSVNQGVWVEALAERVRDARFALF